MSHNKKQLFVLAFLVLTRYQEVACVDSFLQNLIERQPDTSMVTIKIQDSLGGPATQLEQPIWQLKQNVQDDYDKSCYNRVYRRYCGFKAGCVAGCCSAACVAVPISILILKGIINP